MKKRICVLILVLIMIASTGCGNGSNKVTSDSKTISELAIEEFLAFTSIPRPSYSTAKALEYLERFADNQKLSHFRDDYGNFWMDIPASKGYEDYPKIILQAHMDMVCASDTGASIDFETTGITAIVNKEENTITADGTSLGADNGIGIGIILAIAKSDIPHGPLRAIITADEEVGLLGAEQLDEDAVDSDYIINIDYETLGDIVYSSAGTLRLLMSKQYQTCNVSSTMKCYKLTIDGLKGGHSGIDIDKNRLNSACALSKILNELSIDGIDYCISKIDSGEAFNSIARYAKLTFAADATLEDIKLMVDKAINNLKQDFPEEDIKCSVEFENAENEVLLTSNDSKEVINVISSLPQGVLAISETTDGLVQTSNNIGVVTLNDGWINVSLSSRSCVTADLEELYARFLSLASDNGYIVSEMSIYPGWDGNPKAPLLLLTKKAFDSIGVSTNACAIHAGLECSWFTEKREGVQIVSIGPTIENAHTPNETLKVDTVDPTISSILYCLEHIKEL